MATFAQTSTVGTSAAAITPPGTARVYDLYNLGPGNVWIRRDSTAAVAEADECTYLPSGASMQYSAPRPGQTQWNAISTQASTKLNISAEIVFDAAQG